MAKTAQTSVSERPYARFIAIGVIVACVLVIIAIVVSCLAGDVIKKNRQRLIGYESTPVEVVQSAIDEQKAASIRAAYEAVAADETLTPEEAAPIFDSTVFVGDSLTKGILDYGYLSADHVVSAIGVSLNDAMPLVEQAAALYPSNLILSFGENDLIAFEGNADAYIDAYRPILDRAKELLPDGKIYISSVMPAAESRIEGDPVLGAYESYNEAIKKLCESDPDLNYIDTAAVALANSDLYEVDNLHFQRPFYGIYLSDVADRLFS